MRLTLRTLLAWLDDTLPAEEVREIGKQVSETPFAQKLVERIRKVTRRRRLTVPPNSGPDAADPNIVAAYLDNELEAEKVADFEKLCLASDVNLAEVASCHQILSLIKNKAKVPPEARYRMYRLIKGREAVRTSYTPPSPGSISGALPSAAVAEAPPPWSTSETVRPSLLERIGPSLLAATLVVVLGLVGWMNLREANLQIREPDKLVAGVPEDVDPPDPSVPALPPDVPPLEAAEPELVDERIPPRSEDTESAEVLDEPRQIASEDEKGAMPEGGAPDGQAEPGKAVGVVEKTDGVALWAKRGNGTSLSWERLEPGTPLNPGDRLLNLAPFRTTLALGSVQVMMVAQSELIVGAPEEVGRLGFELIEGSVVIRSEEAGATVTVGFEGRTVTIDPPPGRPVGVSWLGLKAPGEPAGRPLLTIMTPEGRLSASADGDEQAESFDGPVLVSFDAEDGFLGGDPAVMPDWVVNPEPAAAEIRAGEVFAELFKDSPGSMTFLLLEGIEDDDEDVRNLSVAALGAMGEGDPGALELVMPLLNRPDAPSLRSTAVGILLRRIARGPDEAEEVRKLLERFVDPPEAAADLDRLLIGYGEEQLAEEDAFERLVGDLSSPNPSVRQLALDTLRMLTGRDSLGYDPDEPDGPGLMAWKELLHAGRLRPGSAQPVELPGGDRRR